MTRTKYNPDGKLWFKKNGASSLPLPREIINEGCWIPFGSVRTAEMLLAPVTYTVMARLLLAHLVNSMVLFV